VEGLEAVWIQLFASNHQPLYICSLYRPNNETDIDLLRKPLELLSYRHHSKPPFIVVAGDLNYPQIDWSFESAADDSCSVFMDILNDFHLQQLVNAPTRYCASVSTMLDLVISSYPSAMDNIIVGSEFSDHCVVSFDVLLSPTAVQNSSRKIYLYRKGDYDQLRSALDSFRCSFFNSLPGSRSANENWLKLKQAITDAAEKHISSKTVNGHKKRHHG